MDAKFLAACFIAAVRDRVKEMLADPEESPADVARYLDECLATLQTEYGFADPRKAGEPKPERRVPGLPR